MRFIFFITLLAIVFPCQAQIKEFAHLYDIDLAETIPDTVQLEKEYRKESSNYDWRYNYSWNMPSVFDTEFSRNIKRFGAIEKRIDSEKEDALLRSIKRLPPAYYPYIGPVLHTVPGLSGKILDLPGIKETKNKFPEHVASPLAGIPNLEFVSPELYIFLMPQIWGEGLNTLEFPEIKQKSVNHPPVRIKKEFINTLLERTPSSDFAINKEKKEKSKGMRHYNATKETPLSEADVTAFIQTLPALRKFQDGRENGISFIGMGVLQNYWDQKNGIDKNVSFLKGVVNPCQNIVRKAQWLGRRYDLQQIVGTQAFGLEDWAYTCDKTIKAFRAASQNNAYTSSFNLLRKGYFYQMINQAGYYTPEERMTHKYFMEAVLQAFSSNQNDIDAVRPHLKQLRKELEAFDLNMLGSPLILP
ncbi:MAG: hypothetical protein Q4D80_05125 [Pseudomonadota bacterium]|nr:hypothetical protein [Pseudomonadota bacterium]